MIIDILLYIIGTMITWIAYLLPVISIYPPELLAGVAFFGERIAALNFFIFDIPAIMAIFIAILQFEALYYLALKIASLVNFFRGSGKIEL